MTTSLDSSAEVAMEEDVKPSIQHLEDDNNNSNNNNNISNNRSMKIKKLRAKLVNEEHRLVLMKKIRQSQTRPISAQQQQQQQPGLVQTNNASPNNLSTHGGAGGNSSSGGVNNISFSTGATGHLRKPIRQSQLSSSSLTTNSALSLQQKNNNNNNNHQSSAANLHALNSSSNNSNNSSNQTPAHAHQRPKVNTLWNPPQQARHPTPAGIAPPHVGNLSRQPITTPPNVVQAMMGSLTGPQSLLMNSIASAQQQTSRRGAVGAQQPQQLTAPNNKMQSSSQLLMQNRSSSSSSSSSSFKPSLQKQLEQTLLQQQQQQRDHHQQTKYVQGLNFSSNLSNKRSVAGITSPHVGNLSRQPITTPPNVVQDMRANLSSSSTGQQSLLMNANNLSSPASNLSARQQQQPQSQQQQQLSPFNKSQATQLLIQRRNAAKTAIQKQLEQNLMQLPQKQIQLAIDFIPNANNIEFVYYIGLEACVDYLTNTKNPLDIEPLEKPLECSTCGTDFTPSWSWKRSNAVCENCVGNHVKKSIKNSQANRIKSALSKAVKQESEMDQRIMAEAASVVSSPGSPATSSSQQQLSLLQPTSQQRLTPQSRNNSLNISNNNNWPRVNQSSPLITTTSGNNNNIRTSNSNVQPAVPPNPLGALPPAAILSLLQMNTQMNPQMHSQLSALASLINPTQPVTTSPAQNPSAATTPLNNSTNSNNTNQFAQVAALLMNQLTTNLWRR